MANSADPDLNLHFLQRWDIIGLSRTMVNKILSLFVTDNPLNTDTRYNGKIRYNDSLS